MQIKVMPGTPSNGVPAWVKVARVTAYFLKTNQNKTTNRGYHKRVMLSKTWGGCINCVSLQILLPQAKNSQLGRVQEQPWRKVRKCLQREERPHFQNREALLPLLALSQQSWAGITDYWSLAFIFFLKRLTFYSERSNNFRTPSKTFSAF